MNVLARVFRMLRMEVMRETASSLPDRAMRAAPGPQAAGVAAPNDPVATAYVSNAWLRPQDIMLDVDVRDGRGAIEAAAALIGRVHGLDPAPIFRALWRREQVGSTALGLGIAIPHARIDGIAHPLTLFMRTRYAIDFGAPDGKPVCKFLVIMVPADGVVDDHLQLLADVAEMFSDRTLRMHLAAATTALETDFVFSEWASGRRD